MAKHKSNHLVESGKTVLEGDFTGLKDYSKEQLVEEIQLLRMSLAEMKANHGVRTEFGYLKPTPFFERGDEEFSRSRRYGSPLTLVVITMLGYENIIDELGQSACDHYVASLARKCKNSCRKGADIPGMVRDDRFGILLPESNIAGCTRFKERLKGELTDSKIIWNDKPIKSGLKISAGVLLDSDTSFNDLFERTIEQTVALDKKVA